MDYTRNIIERLEEYRLENRLTKKDMSAKFGVPGTQHYANWVTRNSLPKTRLAKAAKILGDSEENLLASMDTPPSYEGSVFSQLSDEQKMGVVLSLLDGMTDRDRAAVLARIVTGE